MEGIGSNNFNGIVAVPLSVTSKNDWFEWVKNYLISQDLWKVTSRSARPERYRVKDFAKWRRKNAAALQVIRISCGSHNLPLIREAFEAKVAWDILYDTYNNPPPPPPPPPPPQHSPPQEELEMGILYKAIYEDNWPAAKAFIDRHPGALNAELAATTGETPLHLATRLGNVGIVEELVRLVPPRYLETLDASGNTPLLTVASFSGVIPIAKCMINKNSNLLAIPNAVNKYLVPVTVAFYHDFKEMAHYLYSITPLHVLKPENGIVGPSLLARCLATGDLDIVLDLLQRCKELLFAGNLERIATIGSIAYYLTFSLDKTRFPFWKRLVYHYIKIPSTTAIEQFCVDIQPKGESNKANQGLGFLHWLISHIYNLLGMEEIRKMKLQHAQAKEILNLVCENMMVLNKEKNNMILRALTSAAYNENVEFLLRVVKANPALISLITTDYNMPVFFYAVAQRKAEVFNLLRGFRFKHVVAAMTSPGSNSFLHVAAKLAPASYLNRISGAALQLQRELQWFLEVDSMVDPVWRSYINDEGFKPLDFFKENHKKLRDEGEKWMKETSTSCSLVGAFIVTIMFAAVFTVPGGNDQSSGYPIFLKERSFLVFVIADALSLFSATASVLTFLGILTSRYAEVDFLYSLPRKLMIGLSTLFLSIATMMITFSTTIIIMLQHNSPRMWTLLPVIVLASVPVTLFVFLQFSLLVEIISSTYFQRIFKKKVETWP